MKTSNKFRRANYSDELGVTMVLVAIAMVAIIAMAAMSIDLVTLYLAREEAQRSADGAALAAARVISASGITGTAAPANNPIAWSVVCGPTAVGSTNGWATQAATSVAAQNTVGGQSVNVNVTYSDGKSSSNDCSALDATFAVNPMVTVQVTPVSIPSFFSRIWGSTANTVSASATAEAFNPSSSGVNGVTTGQVTPVQPRCAKPLIVPNSDPGNCNPVNSKTCSKFVNTTDGSVVNPGISLKGSSTNGVIGEQFWLLTNCPNSTGQCGIASTPPGPNVSGSFSGVPAPGFPNLQYVPGQVLATAAAVPISKSCPAPANNFVSAVAGCDQSTIYQCGLQAAQAVTPNAVDLTENPAGTSGDTALGLSCAMTGSFPLAGQDTLRNDGYPFLPFAGDSNPAVKPGTPVTNSNSVMTLPIYDGGPITATNSTITIVGFLQVFVNGFDDNGNVQVIVLNVAGCGSNTSTNPPVFGNSPLPVRLITPQPAQ